MEKIRENIRRRKEAGVYPPDPAAVRASPESAGANPEIARDLAYLSGNWNIQNNSYFISSHRPVVGKYLVKGRELVHGEVRRYVDPVIWKQAEFNRATGRVLEEVAREVSGIEPLREQIREDTTRQIQATIGEVRSRFKERLQEQDSEIRGEISETEEQLRAEVTELVAQVKAEIAEEVREQIRAELTGLAPQLKAEIAREVEERLRAEVTAAVTQAKAEVITEAEERIPGEVTEQVQTAILAMDTDIENRAWLAKVLEGRLHEDIGRKLPSDDRSGTADGIDYFVFSEEIGKSWLKLGGVSCESPNIFDDAPPLFSNCKNVIDIGCGRGALLRSLQNNNIGCYGVDLDETSILYCRRFGLNVLLSDAVEHLQSLEDNSLDGVFIGQVLEHMPADATIYDLIRLSYEKMQYGSYIVIAVPNILSVLVSTNLFYLDPTHSTHIHPEVLKFILNACGFREIQEKFYQPVSDSIKLSYLDPSTTVESGIPENFLKTINSNTDKLNDMLFGYRDYCVFAQK
ncbi:methionine biosynthesis protein MetW [Methanoculleus sp.]|uniref:methionine biosynthesis protein MetW n=1 Tax=Methanoculleus sp. TaxID=90427 RepID=UPI001BD3E979|nr:methionine biosynthesis protein MetW [Methanoculleus sp.]